MRNSLSKVLILLVALTALAGASIGDIFALPGDVWRCNSVGNILPGADATYDVGSSSYRVANGYVQTIQPNQLKFARSAAVTANTTLTAASNSYIGCSNVTAVLTLPSAATCGSGRVFFIKYESTSAGNILVKSSSGTIDGTAAATGVNITTSGHLNVVSDGTNWWSI